MQITHMHQLHTVYPPAYYYIDYSSPFILLSLLFSPIISTAHSQNVSMWKKQYQFFKISLVGSFSRLINDCSFASYSSPIICISSIRLVSYHSTPTIKLIHKNPRLSKLSSEAHLSIILSFLFFYDFYYILFQVISKISSSFIESGFYTTLK